MALQSDREYLFIPDCVDQQMIFDKVLECFNAAKEAEDSPWMRFGDPFPAACRVSAVISGHNTDLHFVLSYGVLILYSFGCPWWATEVLAQEELVLGILPGYDTAKALAAWEARMKLYGISGVVIGTSLAGKRSDTLARFYRQQGYAPAAHILTKEL
jgi:hypothetical protein